ncbi:MAG: hypothetical protein WC438_00690 [Candidatus Pacearchaeota archaeon]
MNTATYTSKCHDSSNKDPCNKYESSTCPMTCGYSLLRRQQELQARPEGVNANDVIIHSHNLVDQILNPKSVGLTRFEEKRAHAVQLGHAAAWQYQP